MEVRSPQLQASGAGIPGWQRLAGKYFYLPLWCLRYSWERTPDVLEAQAGRRRHTLALRTAEVKAEGLAAPSEIVAGYREMLAAFRRAALDAGADRRIPLRHEHPFFGALDAYQWLCFATPHQVVHLKHTRAILRRVSASPARDA